MEHLKSQMNFFDNLRDCCCWQQQQHQRKQQHPSKSIKMNSTFSMNAKKHFSKVTLLNAIKAKTFNSNSCVYGLERCKRFVSKTAIPSTLTSKLIQPSTSTSMSCSTTKTKTASASASTSITKAIATKSNFMQQASPTTTTTTTTTSNETKEQFKRYRTTDSIRATTTKTTTPPSTTTIGLRMLLVTLALFIVVCFLKTSTVGAADTLLGDIQSCSNEGEEIPIPGIKNSKCFKCACQNGFVNCDKETCPSIADCYLLDSKSSDACCKRCKGCIFRGIAYASGTEWTDPDDPCKTYKCIASVVTETTMKCYTQCDDDQLTPPGPGECCPKCQGCKINGQIVTEGQEVVASIDDRCLVCQCTGKKLSCAKKTCPILQCPISKQKLHPSECCPRCTEHRHFIPVTGKCMFSNSLYYDKTQFTPDRCTNCTCTNGTSICQRNTCPILECSPEYQEMDGCCPRCITSEVRSECIYNGTTFKNNETWNLDTCRSCRCTAGNIRCSEMMCPPVKCRANQELKVPAGECCPKCQDTAGVCTVFGDPHFRTFDGKFFSFQGSCKYQLTADCRDHTFSIRLTNDGRGTKRSSWAKTVTLKMKGTRVNLGRKMRIKVNGSRVATNYSGGPIVNIERTAESVVLKTELGINIEWDGNNFLQVIVPASYKHRLCGLCGNYNGLWRDDLTGRDGTNHLEEEVWRFANSWKVGGPKACSRKQEKLASQPICKQRRANTLCRPLRETEVFGNCDNRLNPNNYIESCKMDVCECPTGMCHCDSFAAYAHECRRLGVKLPDWRSETSCPIGVWRRNATLPTSTLTSTSTSTSTLGRYGAHTSQQIGGGGADGVGGGGAVVAGGGESRSTYQHRRQHHRRKKTHQHHQHQQQQLNHNQLLQQHDFITKHVPKNLLKSKLPDRTPPPLV